MSNKQAKALDFPGGAAPGGKQFKAWDRPEGVAPTSARPVAAVVASRHLARMRGGSNAHLMAAGSGDHEGYYVVKFRDNPQGRRTLINEAACYSLLGHLGLPTPGWSFVAVGEDLIRKSPELTVDKGGERARCAPGLHFGSCFVVDPRRQAAYDYVPSEMLRQVVNVGVFPGMVAFDKWVSNADARQAVFFRDRAKRWLLETETLPADRKPLTARHLVYAANMIDHGFAFNAQRWEFSDQPEKGLYRRHEVYSDVRSYESFEPFLSRIVELPPEVIDRALQSPAKEWFDGDRDEFEALLERLYKRRKRVPELLRDAKRAGSDPFPYWHPLSKAVGRVTPCDRPKSLRMLA